MNYKIHNVFLFISMGLFGTFLKIAYHETHGASGSSSNFMISNIIVGIIVGAVALSWWEMPSPEEQDRLDRQAEADAKARDRAALARSNARKASVKNFVGNIRNSRIEYLSDLEAAKARKIKELFEDK